MCVCVEGGGGRERWFITPRLLVHWARGWGGGDHHKHQMKYPCTHFEYHGYYDIFSLLLILPRLPWIKRFMVHRVSRDFYCCSLFSGCSFGMCYQSWQVATYGTTLLLPQVANPTFFLLQFHYAHNILYVISEKLSLRSSSGSFSLAITYSCCIFFCYCLNCDCRL